MDFSLSGIHALTHPSFSSRGWTLDIRPATESDFGHRYDAIIARGGEELCHISIDPFIGTDREAFRVLTERAVRWVIEFETVNLGQREPGPPIGEYVR